MFNALTKLTLCSIAFLLCMPLHAEEETEAKEEIVKTQWLVVQAGTLLAVPGESPLKEKTVVIKDGLIDRILDGYVSGDEVIGNEADAEVEVLDLSESFVLPGLIDVHVHLSFEFDVKGQQSYGSADEYMKQEA